MTHPAPNILDFYANQIPNGSGKYLADILQFDDEELEGYHDFIQ